MLPKEKMDRINELARKAKAAELSPEEKQEQEGLRTEYITKFRAYFKGQLERIKIVDDADVEKNKDMN